jgi:hypothetical protein
MQEPKEFLQIPGYSADFDPLIYSDAIQKNCRPERKSIPVAIDLATTQCQLALLKPTTSHIHTLMFDGQP